MKFSFTVPGKAVPWQRAGYAKPGSQRVIFYTEPETRKYQKKVWAYCVTSGFRGRPWTGPVTFRATFYLPDRRIRDGDNLGKSVLDAITSKKAKRVGKNRRAAEPRLLKDDSQVMDQIVRKRFDAANPRAEIEIEEQPAETLPQLEIALGGKS